MRVLTFVAFGIFIPGIVGLAPPLPPQKCLDYDNAYTVAWNFGALFSNYSSELATISLSPNITDYSDVITLINNACPNSTAPGSPFPFTPLDKAAITSLDDFKAHQGTQPNIPFKILKFWYAY